MNPYITTFLVSTASAGLIATVLWFTTQDHVLTIYAAVMLWFVLELGLVMKVVEKQGQDDKE